MPPESIARRKWTKTKDLPLAQGLQQAFPRSAPISDNVPHKPPVRPARESPTKLKVLLAHYIGFICQAAGSLIGESEAFELCAETRDAATARRLFERHRPRAAIVGPTLRGGDGIQLIKDFRKMDRKAAILMLTAHEDAISVQRALRAGALGYLRIFDGHLELLEALEKICAGRRYVSEGLREVVFENFANNATKGAGAKIDGLTDREREVFVLIGSGAAISEIAAQLGVSPKTIETYQERIKEKLELRTNAALREKASRSAMKSAWRRMERLHARTVGSI